MIRRRLPETSCSRCSTAMAGSRARRRPNNMRTIVGKDRMLCQAPTPEEFAFLVAQRAARKDTGFPVGSEGNSLSFPLMGWLRR
jgi:hypothetical protein